MGLHQTMKCRINKRLQDNNTKLKIKCWMFEYSFLLFCLRFYCLKFISVDEAEFFGSWLSQASYCFWKPPNQFQFFLIYPNHHAASLSNPLLSCLYILCTCFVLLLLLFYFLFCWPLNVIVYRQTILSDLFLLVFVKEAWTSVKICGPICL